MGGVGQWTFLSNHTHVLLCLARSPGLTIRVIAQSVGITERSVQKIIVDLEATGVLVRERVGRNNRYKVDLTKPLRHPLESHCTLLQLMAALGVDEQVGTLNGEDNQADGSDEPDQDKMSSME